MLKHLQKLYSCFDLFLPRVSVATTQMCSHRFSVPKRNSHITKNISMPSAKRYQLYSVISAVRSL